MGSIPIHFRFRREARVSSLRYHTPMKLSSSFHALAVGGIGLTLMGCADESTTDGVTRDFVAVTTAGDEVSGESIRGQVTIVDFWAVF